MLEYEKIGFEKSMASKSAKWIGSDFYSRNICFLFPFSFMVIALVMIMVHISTVRQYGLPTAFFIIFPNMFLLSGLSLRAIIKNNKLVRVEFNCSLTDLRVELKKEFERAGWKVSRSNIKYLTAHKPGFWPVGIKTGILFKNNEAYINVQNMYGSAYFPFSFGRNRKYTIIISQMVKSEGISGLLI